MSSEPIDWSAHVATVDQDSEAENASEPSPILPAEPLASMPSTDELAALRAGRKHQPAHPHREGTEWVLLPGDEIVHATTHRDHPLHPDLGESFEDRWERWKRDRGCEWFETEAHAQTALEARTAAKIEATAASIESDVAATRRARVRDRIEDLRVQREARAVVDSEDARELWRPPTPIGVSTFLADEPEQPSFHVRQMWPYGGTVVLVAPQKWGKTTMTRHTIESVLTGSAFLDYFPVDSPLTRCVLLDSELSERQMWDMWQGTPLTDDQLVIWPLRGSVSTLAIKEDWVRRELVAQLRDTGADLLVIDPLGPLLRANGWDENSNSDVGRCLDLIDEMRADAGITACLIPHHTGHGAAHGRGASVIGDWADAIWTGKHRRASEPLSPRTISAIGRSGVAYPETEMSWNEEEGRPFLHELSPPASTGRTQDRDEIKARAIADRVQQVRQALAEHPDGFTGNDALTDAVGTKWNGTVLSEVRAACIKNNVIQDTKRGWRPAHDA